MHMHLLLKRPNIGSGLYSLLPPLNYNFWVFFVFSLKTQWGCDHLSVLSSPSQPCTEGTALQLGAAGWKKNHLCPQGTPLEHILIEVAAVQNLK